MPRFLHPFMKFFLSMKYSQIHSTSVNPKKRGYMYMYAWFTLSYSCVKQLCMHAKSFSHVQHFVTSWIVAHQAPLSMGFSKQEYWSGLPFPSPVDLPDPGIEPASLMSPALASRFFTTSTTQEASRQLNFNANEQEVTAYILLENVLIQKSWFTACL